MANRFENTFTTADGHELYYQCWLPQKMGSQSILITHGLGEHSDCYSELATQMSAIGWNVYAWDIRGHGQSQGKRGFVDDFATYCLDLDQILKHLELQGSSSSVNTKKLVLFGHSLGGLITLKSLLDYKHIQPDALILSSPALGVALPVPLWKKKFADLAGEWWPELTLYNEIKFRDLTRDEKKVQSYFKDPLRHEKISPRVFTGILKQSEYVLSKSDQIKLPTLMLLAGEDRIVDSNASIGFFESLSQSEKRLIVYKDSFHEVLNGFEAKQVIADIKDFLKNDSFPID